MFLPSSRAPFARPRALTEQTDRTRPEAGDGPAGPAEHRRDLLPHYTPAAAHIAFARRSPVDTLAWCRSRTARDDFGWVTRCLTHDCTSESMSHTSQVEAAEDFLCDLGRRVTFGVQQVDEDERVVCPTEMHYLLRAVTAEYLHMDDTRLHTMDPRAAGSLAIVCIEHPTRRRVPLVAEIALDPSDHRRVEIVLRAENASPGACGDFLTVDHTRLTPGGPHGHVAPTPGGVCLRTDVRFDDDVDPRRFGLHGLL